MHAIKQESLWEGLFAEAQRLYQHALIEEKDLGPERSSVAVFLSNLGLLYQNRGRYLEAESLLQWGSHLSNKGGRDV